MTPAKTSLRLAPGLNLPLSFATEGVVAVGMRGSGKSNTLVRWAELLYGADIPFCAIDPKGDWGGIRSSADGRHPGLSVPVFGGLTGNFPLEEKLGRRIADLLVDSGLSAVLDVSRLSIGARVRFLTDFAEGLMELHQLEPHVRCVIFEEAHRYIPQQVPGPLARLKEAMASILLEGRSFGLGGWAATQRPARLNKDFLEEVGTAIVHRIGAAASNDLRTIAGWVKHEELSDEIVPSLTKLADGEAWVLAPSTLGIARRYQIDRRETFDSASTPLAGAGSRPVVKLADIDAAEIKEALAEAIERADANDPKKLQAQVRQLQKELAQARAHEPEAEVRTVEVETVPAWWPDLIDELDGGISGAFDAFEKVREMVAELPLERRSVDTPPGTTQRTERAPKSPLARREQAERTSSGSTAAAGGLGKGERKVLSVMGQFADEELTHARLAFLAGYSAKASTLGVILANLRRQGLVEPKARRLTTEGLALADPEPLPSGDELLQYWRRHERMGEGERKVLDALVDSYPTDLSHGELCKMTGYSPDASTMGVILSKLRKLGLVEKGARRLVAEFAEAIGL